MKKRKIAFLILTIIVCSFRYATGQVPTKFNEVYSATTAHFANYLEFSRDGNFLVSVVGFNADVYQKKEGAFKLIQTLNGPGSQAMYPGISDDGTFIAFSAWENTYVYKKEGDIYVLQQTIKAPGESPRSDLVLRFTGNNKLMLVGNKGNIRYYELSGSFFYEVKLVKNPSGLDFHKAALSPNGKLLATIDDKGVVNCWQITADTALPAMPVLNLNKYLGILDITNELLLMAGASDSLSIYQLATDLNSAVPIHKFPDDKFVQAKFNLEGNKVMVTTEKGQLGLYSITGKMVKQEYVNKIDQNKFTDVEMSACGQWMAATSMGGKLIKIYQDPSKVVASQTSVVNKKTGNDPLATKTTPVTAKATSEKKTEVKKTTPVNKPVAVKEKPVEVKKEMYPELFVNKVGDFTIFEAGKKYGVKGGMLNNVYYLEAKYDTIIGLRLEEDHKFKTLFVVIDKNGLQVFNPDKSSLISTTEKLTEFMFSDEYLWVKTDKGRWNLYTETISSTTGYSKVQLLYNSFIIFTGPGKIKVAAWDKIHGYFGEDYYIPEGAEVTHFGGPGEFIYKLKNKVGYTNAKTLLYLPPLFDDIKMGMGTAILLKYSGEIYSTTFDNIRIPNYSSSYIIKAQTFGKSCGRSDCRNGIIGMSTQTTGGKVEKRQYEKLTINGRILVISTYVTPVKTTTSAIQCPDRIHDTKRYILEVDKDGVLVRAL